MTSSSSAASATVLAIGPTWESVPNGLGGYTGTRPWVGLRPTMPQKLAGIRIDPAPSVPTASGPRPAATAAAAPPLDPPAVRPRSQGLWVTPVSGLSVTAFQPHSGVVVLPTSTAPCSRSRATAGASTVHGPARSTVREPRSVGHPLVSSRSLTEVGTPSSSPAGSPAAHLRSDARAAASASSPRTRQ